MPEIQSYIINLARNPERMESMRSSFDAVSVPFTRFEACDASQLTDQDIKAFRQGRLSLNKTGWEHIGQIGCFLSHYGVWQKAAQSQHPYTAVFEDDMHLSPDIAYFLTNDSWVPAGCDIIRLETSTNRVLFANRPLSRHKDREILRVKSTTWCAGGYIISRDFARRLIAMPEAMHSSTDDMLFCFESRGVANSLNIAQVFPALCIQDKFFHADVNDIQFESNIESGSMEEARQSRLMMLFKRNPLKAIYRSLQGYKRIPFAA